MRWHDLTALARPLDLRRPSNRLPVAATLAFLLVGTAALLLTGDRGVLSALAGGARLGAGAFLAWSIGREVDPDRVRTSRYAVFVAVPLALLGPPALATGAALLVAARIMLRPTGLPPRTADLLGTVLLAGFAVAAGPSGVPAGLALAGTLVADHRLSRGAVNRLQLSSAAVTAAVTLVGGALAGTLLAPWEGPRWDDLVVLLLTAVAVTQLAGGPVRSRADVTREPLRRNGVERARLAVFVTVLGAVLWTGFDAVTATWPALAALLGGGVAGAVARRDRSVRAA